MKIPPQKGGIFCAKSSILKYKLTKFNINGIICKKLGTYIAKYNSQTGYYEVEITAPETGGIYNADIAFTDIFEVDYETDLAVQILAKEPIKIESNKVFMWIFDYQDFSIKDI